MNAIFMKLVYSSLFCDILVPIVILCFSLFCKNDPLYTDSLQFLFAGTMQLLFMKLHDNKLLNCCPLFPGDR